MLRLMNCSSAGYAEIRTRSWKRSIGEQAARLVLQADLGPGLALAGIVEGAEAAGQMRTSERSAVMALALLHGIARPEVSEMRSAGLIWRYQRLRAGREGLISQHTHQTDPAAAIDESDTPCRENGREI